MESLISDTHPEVAWESDGASAEACHDKPEKEKTTVAMISACIIPIFESHEKYLND